LANVHLRNAVKLALSSAVAMGFCVLYNSQSFPAAVYERPEELLVNAITD